MSYEINLNFGSIKNVFLGSLLVLTPVELFAQGLPAATQSRSLVSHVVFWLGAMALIILMGRMIFREQIHEHRTLRRLIKEIGPLYPEFDIDKLKRWVHLCAPHVWNGWQTGNRDGLLDFSTEQFLERSREEDEDLRAQGWTRESELISVLKVHPLGLYMVGEGPAPADIEIMLRLEEKGRDFIRDAEGTIIEGSSRVQQIQRLWTLKHDGIKWRLDRVWSGADDVVDLATRPVVPPVNEWQRRP